MYKLHRIGLVLVLFALATSWLLAAGLLIYFTLSVFLLLFLIGHVRHCNPLVGVE